MPHDFGNPFADMFQGFFDGSLGAKKAENMKAIYEKARRIMFQPIQAKKCETRQELGDWFENFAQHCKALRPPVET